jgi:hypothetical protein
MPATLLTFPLIDGPLVLDPVRYPAAVEAVAQAMDDGYDAWLGRVDVALSTFAVATFDVDGARAAFDAGVTAADYALQLIACEGEA